MSKTRIENKYNNARLEALLIKEVHRAPLAQNIQKEYNKLVTTLAQVDKETRQAKKISGTGGLISVSDLVAYQIGWVRRVIEWYESGVRGQPMIMPGDGFTTWSYTEMAKQFYETYHLDGWTEQDKEFHRVTRRVLEIVEEAYQNNTLDKKEVWPWQQLKSGVWWPLSKWVQVNTVAPFKKATASVNSILSQLP